MTAPAVAVPTDTTVVKALRRIRMPQTQRNRELGLLLFAFLINGAAVALVQLGATGHIDWTFLYYCGGLTVLVLGLHIVLRYRAPQADPFVVPIATVLSGLGLAMIYRIDIGRSISGWEALSTRQLVWLATTQPGADWQRGEYYEREKPAKSAMAAHDDELARRLWDESERMLTEV